MKVISIGELIKQQRIERNISQEQLCEGICEAATLSRIEQGRSYPTQARLEALLQRLGLPGERIYAIVSDDEQELQQLKDEIIHCNATRDLREGLQKLARLEALAESDDTLTQQFIARSKVLLGKLQGDEILPYSPQEKLELLYAALRRTRANFNIRNFVSHYYTVEELKLINQIAIVLDDTGQQRQATDIYLQLLKYLDIGTHINSSNVSAAILIAYNCALVMCRRKHYDDAEYYAQWGLDLAYQWGRGGALVGSLLYVMGETACNTGRLELGKEYFLQAYYTYKIYRDQMNADLMLENMQDYFGPDIKP